VDLVSPKQVARAIGVSESSLKRWCDQGLIETVRTVGGHRKMPTADVLRFGRECGHALVSPEILGLPPVSERAERGLARSRPQLASALLAGDETLARQIVFDLYVARHPLSIICDEVIAAAFHDIGDRWACHEADVYQERRGCEIALRLLFDVRKVQPQPKLPWIAIGGTIEGDQYTLASTIAELVLRGIGFQTTALGHSIPFPSLIKAVQQVRPHLFWLSVSHIQDGLDLAAEFAPLSQACNNTGTALVVGGRALSEHLRQRMTYAAFGDNMQHLESFATTLLRSLPSQDNTSAGPSRDKKPTARRTSGHRAGRKRKS
jgi:methanogenic corrinoid protein MtbC1